MTRSAVRRFVPPQHGAWAMLAVPYLAALLVAGAIWVHLPLLGAWLGGYLLSYYVFQAIKSRRPRRYRDQLLWYAALTLPLALVVVWARPAVLWYAPAYAVLIAVNAWYAWRRQERALLNDLAAVAQSCLMVFLVATIAGQSPAATIAGQSPAATIAGNNPASMAGVFLACAAYFIGTVLFVKTMIRERDNPSYLRWSIGYHVAAFGLGLWLGPALAAFFAWLLIRAWWFPRRRFTPKQLGFIEIGNSLVLLAAVGAIWG